MVKQQQPDPNITIETNVTREQIADDIFATVLTGIVDIGQTLFLDGRTILIEKVYPFSVTSAIIAESNRY